MTEPATKMVSTFEVIDPSPMPVLLTNPTPDARYNGQPTVRVEPGQIRLGSRPYRLTEVVWLNETGDEVTFTFDAGGSAKFFNLPTDPSALTIKNNQELKLTISQTVPENSIYSYRIDCKATPDLPAQGNSPPQVSCP